MTYTVVKRIKRSGWPVYTKSGKVSQKWKKGHAKANREALKRFGAKVAKAVNKIKVPKNELLGSHTRKGKIKVSSLVKQVKSKSMRRKVVKAVGYHEFVEHRYMKGRR